MNRRARAGAMAVLMLAALLAAACSRSTAPAAVTSGPAATPVPAVVMMTRATPASGTATPTHAMPVQLSPFPNAAESKFVAAVSGDLRRRFSTVGSAEAAGYIRYTAEDDAGIITYTNLRWFGDDPRHPTQLWYDAGGHLIGADFTVPVTDRMRRPGVWGLAPGRWVHFISHIHYIVRAPDGTPQYGSMLNAVYRANGGDPAHPTARPLVRAGIVKRARDVRLVFQLPELWIASLWLIPNPNGAFADLNPQVKPTQGKHQNAHPSGA